MSRNVPINVPIATSQCNSATFTLPWFVQGAEYRPDPATFKPLVNGEDAFGAVYDAIEKAQHSIDIICWGFQPSMHFKRGSDGQGTLPIGKLLEYKGMQGRKVRLLVWSDSLHVAQFSENMMPGNNVASSILSDTRNSTQREIDRDWYSRANLTNVTRSSATRATRPFAAAEDIVTSIGQYAQRNKAMSNVEFATRDFNLTERAEIAWRTWTQGADTARSTLTKDASAVAMAAEPTHHQKMVLVDYEHPKQAIGFVMGHNTLDEYWDTDRHSCQRMHPQMGRNGKAPRQDISSRVTGPILRYLNRNFCQAWDDATGQKLAQERAAADAATAKTQLRRDFDTPVMAQILRTQAQHDKAGKDSKSKESGIRDIETMYLQTLNNTTNFIYIENQYFRYPPLAKKLKDLAAAYKAGGRKTPLHLFVVTNASTEALDKGEINTYRMMAELGRADTIPVIAKLERTGALKQQYEQAARQTRQASDSVTGMHAVLEHADNPAMRHKLDTARQQLEAAQRKEAEARAALEQAESKPIVPEPIPGLNVHLCTLVAPDTPPGQKWVPVYVHAKLMMVDDVFMTLGSANINTRSMMADSELNICHERASVTQPLREHLWNLHTGGMGVGKKIKDGRMDAEDAFKQWQTIIDENKARIKNEYKESPYAPLVEFYYDGAKRSNLD